MGKGQSKTPPDSIDNLFPSERTNRLRNNRYRPHEHRNINEKYMSLRVEGNEFQPPAELPAKPVEASVQVQPPLQMSAELHQTRQPQLPAQGPKFEVHHPPELHVIRPPPPPPIRQPPLQRPPQLLPNRPSPVPLRQQLPLQSPLHPINKPVQSSLNKRPELTVNRSPQPQEHRRQQLPSERPQLPLNRPSAVPLQRPQQLSLPPNPILNKRPELTLNRSHEPQEHRRPQLPAVERPPKTHPQRPKSLSPVRKQIEKTFEPKVAVSHPQAPISQPISQSNNDKEKRTGNIHKPIIHENKGNQGRGDFHSAPPLRDSSTAGSDGKRKLIIRGLKRFKESRGSCPPAWVREFPCRSRFHPDNYIYDFAEGPNIPKRNFDAMNKCVKKGGRCGKCGIYTADVCLKCRHCDKDCNCNSGRPKLPQLPMESTTWEQAQKFLSDMRRFPNSEDVNSGPCQYPFNSSRSSNPIIPGPPPPSTYFPPAPMPPNMTGPYGYPSPYPPPPTMPYGYPAPPNYGGFSPFCHPQYPQGFYGPVPPMIYGYPPSPQYFNGPCPTAPTYSSHVAVNSPDP